MPRALPGFRSVVALDSIEVDPHTKTIHDLYVERFGEWPADRGGWYSRDDWARIAFVLGAIGHHGRFLDVGLGAGQFINVVARAHRFDEVHGVDRMRFEKYVEFDDRIERHQRSIVDLPFPDDHFDVVTCMEVLEHLPADAYEAGLAELRRVSGGQLLMSVPFEEREPIFHGHERRYELDDLLRDFRDADLVALGRPVNPWALLEEWHGPSANPHRLRLAAVEALLRPTAPTPRSARARTIARRLPPPARSAMRAARRAVGR